MASPISTWLIDDDDTFRDVMTERLRLCLDIHPSSFPSCEEALLALEKGEKPPQVILLDIQMKGMSGIRGISEFKKHASQSRVIMLTRSNFDEDIKTSMREGAYSYVQKTAPPDEVINAVTKAAGGFRHFDQATLAQIIDGMLLDPQAQKKFGLTERDVEILKLLARGFGRLDIAKELDISEGTVITHLERIHERLNVEKSTEAVAKAIRERII